MATCEMFLRLSYYGDVYQQLEPGIIFGSDKIFVHYALNVVCK